MMRKPKELLSFIMLDRNACVQGFFLWNDLQTQENLSSICGSHEALISHNIMLQPRMLLITRC